MIHDVCIPAWGYFLLMFAILLGTLLHYKPLKNIFRTKTEKPPPNPEIVDDHH